MSRTSIHIKTIFLIFLITVSLVISGLFMASASYSDNLEVFFFDVGEGDAAAVLCEDSVMLIDGGSPGASQILYSFLEKHGIRHVDYIITSHPDEDHVGGLAAVPYAVDSIGTVLCTDEIHSTGIFESFVKNLDERYSGIIVPDAGDSFMLGNAECTILSPEKGQKLSNNTSIILRISYGSCSFLFTGDAEAEDEENLLHTKSNLKSTVLKVGHHGSNSSSTEEFLRAVSPQYAVISVGANNYGHPAEQVLDRLQLCGTRLYRTDLQGEIHCVCDGNSVLFSVDRNADADTYAHSPATLTLIPAEETGNTQDGEVPDRNSVGTDYICNTNTGKFHYPECSSVKKMKEENKWYYVGSRDELIEMGYVPCGNCHP